MEKLKVVLPGLRAWFSLDIYSVAGILVLLISSVALVFIVISNWNLIAAGSDKGYYLAIILTVSTVPLAMLLLYLINIRSDRIGIEAKKIDSDSDIEDEELAVAKQHDDRIDREIGIEGVVDREQKKEPAEQTQTPEGLGVYVASNMKIDVKDMVKEEVVRATTDLISKIEGFSREITEVKKELEEMKNTVESAMIDIRSLLSEISNPLNYMRRFATEEELEELRLSPDQGVSVNEEKRRPSTEAKKSSDKTSGHNNSSRNAGEVNVESTDIEDFSRELVDIFSKNVSVSRLMRIIIFVGDNLSTLGRDGLLGVVELGVSSGVIPRESMDIVAKVVSLIESTKIPPKRLAITLHRLAKSIGVSDKEAEFLAMALSEG